MRVLVTQNTLDGLSSIGRSTSDADSGHYTSAYEPEGSPMRQQCLGGTDRVKHHNKQSDYHFDQAASIEDADLRGLHTAVASLHDADSEAHENRYSSEDRRTASRIADQATSALKSIVKRLK